MCFEDAAAVGEAAISHHQPAPFSRGQIQEAIIGAMHRMKHVYDEEDDDDLHNLYTKIAASAGFNDLSTEGFCGVEKWVRGIWKACGRGGYESQEQGIEEDDDAPAAPGLTEERTRQIEAEAEEKRRFEARELPRFGNYARCSTGVILLNPTP